MVSLFTGPACCGPRGIVNNGRVDAAELRPSLAPFMDAKGRFTAWPVKQRLQRQAIAYIATKFQPGIIYSEGEVNELLMLWHTFRDWARLRRMLYDLGYVDRDAAGSAYTLASSPPTSPE